MKALFLTKKVIFPSLDGECLVIAQDIKLFQTLGYDIFLLSLNTNKHFIDHHKAYELLPNNINMKIININTDIEWAKLITNFFSTIPYNIERFYSHTFLQTAIEIIKENQFDFIVFEGLHLSVYASHLQMSTSTPFIMRSHNVESELWERRSKKESNFLKKIYTFYLSNKINNYEINSFHLYKYFISISQRDLALYKQKGLAAKTFVLPYTLEDPFLEVPLKDENSIFFIGSFDWLPNYEGIKWFIENVWAEINLQFPHWTFYIAGRNMNVNESIFYKNGIKILGEIKDVTQLMRDYNIMIVPLFSGSGIRIKIIEALFHAKTIISTSLGAEGVYDSSSSDIIIANTKNEFIESISSLIINSEKLKKIGEKNRNYALENFDFKFQILKLKNFLE